MIADGRIKVRSGVYPEKFTEEGVVLSDGSELPADAVVFAYVPGERDIMLYDANVGETQDGVRAYEGGQRRDLG